MRTINLLAIVTLAAVLLPGCRADKRLWIETDPPGAEIRLDHCFIGTTPHTMEFTHYGTHRLALSLDGYEPYERELLLPVPWYARFPIDIISEVVLPMGWTDHKLAYVELQAKEFEIDPEALARARARAQVFREATGSIPDDLPAQSEASESPLVAEPR